MKWANMYNIHKKIEYLIFLGYSKRYYHYLGDKMTLYKKINQFIT